MRLFWLFSVAAVASAWTANNPSRTNRADILTQQQSQTRRGFLLSTIVTAAPLLLPLQQANAAAPPGKDAEVLVGKLSVEDAKKRFQLARKDVAYLLDNYSDISRKGGGDAIRNYLGTQGVTSNLFGIQKVLKILQEESDDIVEYSETMEEFNAYYYQAEGAAYQSMFAEHSSSRSTPQELLATAKKDLTQMAKYMDQLAVQLNL